MTGRSPPQRPLEGRTILIVEDEYFIAEEMVSLFTRAGATVIGPAGSVEDALELIEETPMLDGAVLDVNLRGETVYPVADALRERGILFFFATGYDSIHIPAPYRNVTCQRKPLDPAMMIALLQVT